MLKFKRYIFDEECSTEYPTLERVKKSFTKTSEYREYTVIEKKINQKKVVIIIRHDFKDILIYKQSEPAIKK